MLLIISHAGAPPLRSWYFGPHLQCQAKIFIQRKSLTRSRALLRLSPENFLMRSLYRIIGAILLIYVAAVAVFAQAGYEAQIRGRVTDPAGAVVVGATVTLRDAATNISQSVKRPIRAEVIRSTP
jgi:hypothetical protein